jgi:hypothetical protein
MSTIAVVEPTMRVRFDQVGAMQEYSFKMEALHGIRLERLWLRVVKAKMHA